MGKSPKKSNLLIIEYGIYSGSALQNLDVTINLPVVFSDTNYNVNITGENTSGTMAYIFRTGIRKISVSSFEARCSGPTTSDKPNKINWIAMG